MLLGVQVCDLPAARQAQQKLRRIPKLITKEKLNRIV